jgi:phosphopantetheinyl transferase
MKIKPDFPIKLLLIKLSDDFDYISYSKVFSLLNWGKINSYLQKKDQLRAFVSELLQTYWLTSILAINPEKLEISFTIK